MRVQHGLKPREVGFLFVNGFKQEGIRGSSAGQREQIVLREDVALQISDLGLHLGCLLQQLNFLFLA